MGIDRATRASRQGSPAALAGLVTVVAAAIAAAGVLGAAWPVTLPGAATPGGDLPSVVDGAGAGG